jgi:hypothetical protein
MDDTSPLDLIQSSGGAEIRLVSFSRLIEADSIVEVSGPTGSAEWRGREHMRGAWARTCAAPGGDVAGDSSRRSNLESADR